ncbi:hypothetical protein [Desulfurispora thermophila]|uniref:hypothetical protein n=1 Tax=Desulfurispora thermophila TaxID=265470 RepID=UPI000368DFAE|nr:hypothetical protein [Desulfurispora thermophila]
MKKQETPGLPWSAKIVMGLLIVAVVLVAFVIFEKFKISSWPAYVAMILFFIVHENVALVPNIIIGGAFGIFSYFLLGLFVKATAMSMGGIFLPVLIFVGVFVFLIVLLTDILPYLFNSFAFLYFTISTVASASEGAHAPLMWVRWVGCEIIGGLLLIAGVIGTLKVVGSMIKSTVKSEITNTTIE